jgi:hypothetical protein
VRYVLIRDDASVADIDEALQALRTKRDLAKLEVIRTWIGEDIDELLEMRSRASLLAMR